MVASDKPRRIDVNIIPTLNRGMIYTAFPKGEAVQFTILHHKQTSGLQFQYDSKNLLIKKEVVKIQMYRNLETCPFCNAFLDVETIKNDKFDYRSKFSGIKKDYSQFLIPFMQEKLDLQSSNNTTKSNGGKNYLLVLGWKLHGLEDELQFFFVQRKCYHPINRVNIIRTAAIQFATDRGMEGLNKYIQDKESTSFIKRDNVPDLNQLTFDEDEDEEI